MKFGMILAPLCFVDNSVLKVGQSLAGGGRKWFSCCYTSSASHNAPNVGSVAEEGLQLLSHV